MDPPHTHTQTHTRCSCARTQCPHARCISLTSTRCCGVAACGVHVCVAWFQRTKPEAYEFSHQVAGVSRTRRKLDRSVQPQLFNDGPSRRVRTHLRRLTLHAHGAGMTGAGGLGGGGVSRQRTRQGVDRVHSCARGIIMGCTPAAHSLHTRCTPESINRIIRFL